MEIKNITPRSAEDDLALYAIARAGRYSHYTRNTLLLWIQERFPYAVNELFKMVVRNAFKNALLPHQHIDLIFEASQNMESLRADMEVLRENNITIVPLSSHHYPKILFERLPLDQQPSLLYVKGNPLHVVYPVAAIASVRQAGARSLAFTKDLLGFLQDQQTPLICGSVSNIDLLALDFAVSRQLPALALLSRGILSQSVALNDLFREADKGYLTIISPFPPFRGWSETTETIRQRMMHLLSKRSFIVETQRNDPVFSAAAAAILQKHPSYIRVPSPKEKTGNESLIIRGGLPVDSSLNVLFHESFGERLNSYLAGKRATLAEIKKHFRIRNTEDYFKEDIESLADIGYHDIGNTRTYYTRKPELNQISLFGDMQ